MHAEFRPPNLTTKRAYIARNSGVAVLTIVRDCSVWTRSDTAFSSNLKTGRDEKSLVDFESQPFRGPSSAQVRKLLFRSLSNSARYGL